ncbi:hypothetical protein PICMEDRAFT_36707 [Pichia membranifaciens NRRL Y-2026]|uniref:Long chronological lifespan protein 2 n=1 Tax=Pichia membranifaciens NRRL Y-2026 TaxID=763406 RepID=A0A1E3NFA7_9ASCO|nr:hypothetical protein PICMEDRAFT_36707 [Pichia membranifaciens NRRL Y-2026]ODQ44835.1 hypothetical protein PICMEDRAFT_36707 [Pichia membranifaciens NRRL Y-2026]
MAGLLILPASAFFDQFFAQQQRQQQQPQRSHEDEYLSKDCGKYLCPDTLACVSKPVDCPCPFPNSQQKCVFPPHPNNDHDDGSYICISKGSRDCKFVVDAYNGLV